MIYNIVLVSGVLGLEMGLGTRLPGLWTGLGLEMGLGTRLPGLWTGLGLRSAGLVNNSCGSAEGSGLLSTSGGGLDLIIGGGLDKIYTIIAFFSDFSFSFQRIFFQQDRKSTRLNSSH